jgi:hypothetical protein
MPRKSLAIFLATTGLITTLAGCGGREAGERGGDDDRPDQSAPMLNGSPNKDREPGQGDNSNKGENGEEGGEGGEGGEG